jgi:hypothetical protein
MVLSLLFIIYLIIGNTDNLKLAQIVDIPQMKAAIIIISFLLFVHCNKILVILGIFVAYEILNFSHTMINENMVNEMQTEIHQSGWGEWTSIRGLNSMEEEIIFKMMPHYCSEVGSCPYNPFSKL